MIYLHVLCTMLKKTAIAILTYNRIDALQVCLTGLRQHCPDYPLAVFEDCGNVDSTRARLAEGNQLVRVRDDILADEYSDDSGAKIFLGQRNLGVAGNSNRAMKWFMEETDCDHLILMNDDVEVLGDFCEVYREAHNDIGVDLFCFCDFTSEQYRWVERPYKGYVVKVLTRMTGMIMSKTRRLIERIGYYDTSFGKFGEEHCDWTIRARLSGFIKIEGTDQHCLDVKHDKCRHQEVETTMVGEARDQADFEAAQTMQKASVEYRSKSHFRPFSLVHPHFVGSRDDTGIPYDDLSRTHQLVVTVDPMEL